MALAVRGYVRDYRPEGRTVLNSLFVESFESGMQRFLH